ncbi:MAG: hypothetical protein IT521_09380 [Burkholderiales bacterium]|nr:hypothetical protein [Burkholderiales bacterium]
MTGILSLRVPRGIRRDYDPERAPLAILEHLARRMLVCARARSIHA